jgi:Tol biopolymer transport system component
MQNCKKIKVIIDEYDNLNEGTGVGILGGSLSPDGKFLLYTRETNRSSSNPIYSLLKMDMSNGEIIVIGEGINPRWSPDGSKIAYLQLDGIYVMSADGTQSKRIVAHDMSSDAYPGKVFDFVLPEPQWSPDGNWLIYHLLVFQSKSSNDADIFKLNIATGDEVKVTDDGLYPYWRK